MDRAIEWIATESKTTWRNDEKTKEIRSGNFLMAVSAIVLESGGDEDQAIAALLHDAVEDQGGLPTLDTIRRLFGDRVADIVRECSDTAGRPLLNVVDDEEKLFGKKILISPDMPTAAGSKAILFGDLGQFQVRVIRSGASVLRNFQAPGYAEKAAALYIGFIRVVAALNAPNGAKPVVYGTLHS